MTCRNLLRGCGYLLAGLTAACGTPDSRGQTGGQRPTEPRVATGRGFARTNYPWEEPSANSPVDSVERIVCPVPVYCYTIRFPDDSALLRPLPLRRGFTGKMFVAVQIDTARRQLGRFRLQAAILHPRTSADTRIALNFNAGEPVPDSLASLLPRLKQHLRKLQPQVKVAGTKDCEMPGEWIIPVQVR